MMEIKQRIVTNQWGFLQDPLTIQVNEGVRINQSIAEGARCTIMNLPADFHKVPYPDRDCKRTGEVGTSGQRSTQRRNTTPTCGSRTY